ncbi:MAG: DEAD/DEAH box helicase [Victivallaceae bacterium]|nr:DEAD/DEAH box helicase [Victivallaceae bacterium]
MNPFESLGLSPETAAAAAAKGFTTPTPIQELAIPELLNGACDLIGQAQTGTGKTAAFGLPIIERLEPGAAAPGALVLSPTRELAMQIAEELESLKGDKKLRIGVFYGGQPIGIQLRRLDDGVDVAVGTPGRVLDLVERGKLNLESLKFAVLDEADEMLDMGFIEDIETILARTNEDRRMLMFSATMPPEILNITGKFMHEPKLLRTAVVEPGGELTEEIWYEVRREDKFEALMRLIDSVENLYALIFCRTKADVDEVTEKLKQRNCRVEALHGDIAQIQRTKVINLFKEKRFRLLAATDVAARGIDVNDLTHVINFSLPQDPETYIHRIGRTGRAGHKGVAVTFVTPGEKRRLVAIEKATGREIEKRDLPTGDDVVNARKKRFAADVAGVMEAERQVDCREFAAELAAAAGDPVEALAAVLKLRFRDELRPERYFDFNRRDWVKRDRKFFENSGLSDGEVRLRIGVGKLDSYGAVRMLELLWEKAHVRKSRIGRIDCFDRFSFVNVASSDAPAIFAAFAKEGPRVSEAEPDKKGQHGDDRPARPARAEKHAYGDDRPARAEKRAYGDDRPARPRDDGKKKPYRDKKAKPTMHGWVEKLAADVELKEKRKASPRRKK